MSLISNLTSRTSALPQINTKLIKVRACDATYYVIMHWFLAHSLGNITVNYAVQERHFL